ncbi:hypothetical protein BLNAU_16980 [Blattamonas nauphoetae]|uniref:Uncharacterized protein n=1 Tax=Blattamonas nauphoetae TaxID=2049346 RepID=A0ABQ9XA32_9EUKA|nr:hypothetical protein BLNAU_16980 [Blattamonas nauphoetae]
MAQNGLVTIQRAISFLCPKQNPMTTLQSPTPPKPKQDTILLSNQTALMEREEEALVLEKSLRTGTMAICPDEASLKLLWKLEAGNELDFGGDLVVRSLKVQDDEWREWGARSSSICVAAPAEEPYQVRCPYYLNTDGPWGSCGGCGM